MDTASPHFVFGAGTENNPYRLTSFSRALDSASKEVSDRNMGENLPDAGILPPLSETLHTTADALLNAGGVALSHCGKKSLPAGAGQAPCDVVFCMQGAPLFFAQVIV